MTPTAGRLSWPFRAERDASRSRAIGRMPHLVAVATRIIEPIASGLLVAYVLTHADEARAFIASVRPGIDFVVLRDSAAAWMHGSPYYPAVELAGPYQIDGHLRILYPPTALVLFVPFTFLPAILWWALPLGILALWIAWCRPRPIAVAVIAWMLAMPKTIPLIIAGNPTMWLAAAVALGIRWGWPSVLFVFKPTLMPFALLGVHRRGWWIALATAAALSLAFLPMWFEWFRVMANARNSVGIWYSLADVPFLLIPIVAWLGRSRRSEPDLHRPVDGTVALIPEAQR